MKRLLIILLMISVIFGCSTDGLGGSDSPSSARAQNTSLGMAITPKNFPCPFHGSPAELPDDYYSWIYHHI